MAGGSQGPPAFSGGALHPEPRPFGSEEGRETGALPRLRLWFRSTVQVTTTSTLQKRTMMSRQTCAGVLGPAEPNPRTQYGGTLR